jgi:hypothetical protein
MAEICIPISQMRNLRLNRLLTCPWLHGYQRGNYSTRYPSNSKPLSFGYWMSHLFIFDEDLRQFVTRPSSSQISKKCGGKGPRSLSPLCSTNIPLAHAGKSVPVQALKPSSIHNYLGGILCTLSLLSPELHIYLVPQGCIFWLLVSQRIIQGGGTQQS